MVVPVTDVDSLKEFIRERTRETWEQRHTPYYMSYVAIDLRKSGIDYRQFIAPLKLSQWVSSTTFADTKVVAHPRHKAKIGFVPADVEFEFTDEKESLPRPAGAVRRGRLLFRFVETLMDLPDDAIDTLQVPAKTLVALLKN